MRFSRSFKLAIQSIWSSKARSLLTMLGIIIGVAAVIVIEGLGNGMSMYMNEAFEEYGIDQITVMTFDMGETRQASVDDMYAALDENKELFSDMSPIASMQATVKVGTEQLKSTTLSGVGESYLINMKKYKISKGRDLQYADIMYRNNVCVVGSYIDQEWYGREAVGQKIRIGAMQYEIVGVLEENVDSTKGTSDDYVYLPYSTVLKATKTKAASEYCFLMVSQDQATEAKQVLEDALYQIYKNSDYYYVQSMTEMLDMANEQINVMVTILTIIAAISLLVGGIGIMNIMLVSVSERTNEIGIRKALGAKRRDIMSQFVIESGTTSAIGGAIGIIIGYLLSTVATNLLTAGLGVSMQVVPPTDSVIASFAISAGIGVLFGYLPAKRAAMLNPIDALRHD